MKRWAAILADDDPAPGNLVRYTLDQLNYDVAAVTSPCEVVTVARAYKTALVLVAPSLPDLDASEVCKELHAEPGHRYVICLLERYDPGTMTAAFAAGADDAIAKPFIAGELTARLQHARHVLALEDFRRTFEDEGKLLAEISTRASFHSRRYLHAQLTNELARARRFAHALALIVAEVRRNHGNERVMRTIGQLLSAACRSRVDWIARHSKQCFALVLPETDLAGALRAAARLQGQLSSDALLVAEGLPKGLIVNLGVTALHGDRIASVQVDSPQVLLDAAEAYLRDAARMGPNHIAGGPAPRAPMLRREK